MKLALTFLVIFSSFSLMANTLNVNCSFTEPFINIGIATDTDTAGIAGDKVLINSPDGTKETLTINHSINSSDFELVFAFEADKTNNNILKVSLLSEGSDGMSDKVYNAEGILILANGSELIGGCDLTN